MSGGAIAGGAAYSRVQAPAMWDCGAVWISARSEPGRASAVFPLAKFTRSVLGLVNGAWQGVSVPAPVSGCMTNSA